MDSVVQVPQNEYIDMMEDKIETVEESCASEEEQPSVDTEDMAKDKERIPPKDDPENNLFYRTDGSIIDVNSIQRHIQMKWSDKTITGYLSRFRLRNTPRLRAS